MHLAMNAWFWNRPDTGSGQYVRRLVEHLPSAVPDLTITLVAPRGRAADVPAGVGLKTVPLHQHGHLAKLRFEQQLFPRVAGELQADLAHVPYWGGPLRSPVPIIVTVHDLIPMLLPEYRGGAASRLYTGLVAASTRGASAVITDSEASRRDILAHLGLPPERVHTVLLAAGEKYHPRSGSLFDLGIRKKYDLPPEFILYLGGYDVRKNIEMLLRAFLYVQKGYDIPLVLAGVLPETITPRFSDVPSLVKSLGLEDAVRFIGWVDEGDAPALYRLASCFVFPSRYEGFGLPVLEALSSGIPVVACDTSSIPEITGDAAFLVEPDDARHMGGAILSTLLQEDLAADLKQRALARARLFSWERTAAETAAIYRQVLSATK